jgi:hypothetical protein
MQVVKSKITKSGVKINIMQAHNGKKEFFAQSKRYWIAADDGSPRIAVNCSNNLKYIEKKFEEIE